MTAIPDPQHQAVISATEGLNSTRHFTRSGARQGDYLHDLEGLAAEVLLNLREAGIGDGAILEAYHRSAESPFASLEAVVRTACEEKREALSALEQTSSTPAPQADS